MDTIFTKENYTNLNNKLEKLKNSAYAKKVAMRIKRFNDYSEDEKKLMLSTSEISMKSFIVNSKR